MEKKEELQQYLYVVHGGLLTDGYVKIGMTQDKDKILNRYRTYYGHNVKANYVITDNAKEDEQRVMIALKDIDNCYHSNELFQINVDYAKRILRLATNNTICRTCE